LYATHQTTQCALRALLIDSPQTTVATLRAKENLTCDTVCDAMTCDGSDEELHGLLRLSAEIKKAFKEDKTAQVSGPDLPCRRLRCMPPADGVRGGLVTGRKSGLSRGRAYR
jgi:hypothetical protein